MRSNRNHRTQAKEVKQARFAKVLWEGRRARRPQPKKDPAYLEWLGAAWEMVSAFYRAGFTNKDGRYMAAVAGRVLGRPVRSSRELSPEECARVRAFVLGVLEEARRVGLEDAVGPLEGFGAELYHGEPAQVVRQHLRLIGRR